MTSRTWSNSIGSDSDTEPDGAPDPVGVTDQNYYVFNRAGRYLGKIGFFDRWQDNQEALARQIGELLPGNPAVRLQRGMGRDRRFQWMSSQERGMARPETAVIADTMTDLERNPTANVSEEAMAILDMDDNNGNVRQIKDYVFSLMENETEPMDVGASLSQTMADFTQ